MSDTPEGMLPLDLEIAITLLQSMLRNPRTLVDDPNLAPRALRHAQLLIDTHNEVHGRHESNTAH